MTSESDEHVLLTPPGPEEVATLARGLVSAVGGRGGAAALTDLQQLLVRTLFHSMTGFDIDPATVTAIDANAFAEALARRNAIFRARIVQVMLLVTFSSRPLTTSTVESVRSFADALGVREDTIDTASRFAEGAFDLASIDFARNGYLGAVTPERLAALHAVELDESWGQVADDAALAGRWSALETLPAGTIGRGVADFYRDRGFVYPGLPGSAPPLLAQHDWAHVLAGYGTSLENEIEVFAFMARANDDPRAFSLLAMVVSLFETGYLAAGAGLFEADPGHLARQGMAARLADAMRRGALTAGSHDLLDQDWFAIADYPVAVVREQMGIVPKDASVVAAGSASAWETGGITQFQIAAAQRAARARDREYVPWVPDPARA